jgi:hypothetical protein
MMRPLGAYRYCWCWHTELPENPCDLLSVKQVAAAGVEISRAERVLSQQESIESSQPGRQRSAGSICRYNSPSRLVSIAVIFPDRRGPLDSRSQPARCRAGSEPVDSRDDRIWRAGGATAVCVGPDLVVWISVQMAHEPGATEAATGVARAIVQRLPA